MITQSQKNFNTKQAADYLDGIGTPFTAGTLEVWRSRGRGPRFKRINGRVFYEKSALDEFSNGQTVETIDSVNQ